MKYVHITNTLNNFDKSLSGINFFPGKENKIYGTNNKFFFKISLNAWFHSKTLEARGRLEYQDSNFFMTLGKPDTR